MTLNIDADLPDPNLWTKLRLSINARVPCSGTVTVPLVDMIRIVTGAGPWVVSLTIPFTVDQTLALPARTCDVQMDFETTADEDVLLEGTVVVLEPRQTLV